jgi:ABC-2 type transport system permease protein
MATDVRSLPTSTTASLTSRLFGLGSVYGKTLRDSRRAILLVAGFMSLMWLISGAFIASQWPDEASRAEGVALTTALPAIFTGLYGGAAVNADTIGGFTNWRYGLIFFLLPGVWSLIALSGTLVSEMKRGSMDLVAATPMSRREIALAKLGAHATAMAIAMLIVAGVAWLVGTAFATLPDDAIGIGDALGYVLLMGLAALAAGTLAFALAPFMGRGGAAGVAALVLVGSWIINGFRDSVPALEALSPLSWFTWTAGHRPIAGLSDYASLVPLVGIVGLASTVGVLAFGRRDLGEIGAVRLPSLPRWILGVTGPMARALGERFSASIAWGIGIGIYAVIIATSSADLQRIIDETPSLRQIMEAAFPGVDLSDPGFGLQLLFVQLGTLVIGFASAALVGGWASDESEGRLELLLTTPVSRASWFVRSALGTVVAIVLTSLVVAGAAALGVAMTGDDVLVPFTGTFVLALYGAAMAGFGFAIGGLVRPSLAAAAVIVVVVGLLLLDILGPLLELPDWVRELALASQYGEPMVGSWEATGVIASLVLAFGGIAIGAWGFARRDLRS